MNFDKQYSKKKLLSIALFIILIQSPFQITSQILVKADIDLENGDNHNSSTKYFEGYNLYILERQNISSYNILDRKIMITDMENNVYLEKSLSNISVLADIEFYNASTLIYGDSGNIKMWNIYTGITTELGFGSHHDIEINYVNNSILALGLYQIDIDENTYVYDLINEYSLNGTLMRTFYTSDFVKPWQICPFVNLGIGPIEVTHVNSISFDEDEMAIYVNCRNQNTFYKIDSKTGKLIWGLGEYGNFTMYDINGKEKDYLFFHSHSLKKIADNKFLLFDNDFHNKTDAIDKKSRYLEITIDEEQMVARVTKEWISPEEYFSPIWGDCDLLPNNNFFGAFSYTTNYGQETGSKLVEVNDKGEIVWLLESPIDEGIKYTIYKVERVRVAPFVSPPSLFEIRENTYFAWDVRYNFNANTRFEGKYFILLDDQLMELGNISFKKYWQSNQVQYNLGDIDPGEHEISLIVQDEVGHLSNETKFYDGTAVFNVHEKILIGVGISLGLGLLILSIILLAKRNLAKV